MSAYSNNWEDVLRRLEAKDATLTVVCLGYEDMTADDVAVLCRAMEGNNTLTTLDLDSNKIGDDGATVISLNTTLLSLDLRHNDIGDKGVMALAGNSTLRELDLYGNRRVSNDGVVALARNTTLTILGLRFLDGIKIGHDGLRFLDGNKIRHDGWMALARNTTLLKLDLCQTTVGDDGATALAQNSTLKELILYSSNIGDSGASALARNTTLTKLNLGSNNIGDHGAVALSHNTTLISLDLSYNEIGYDGAVALSRNTTLISLELSSNENGYHGALALSRNTTLTKLNLHANGAAASALSTTLVELHLDFLEPDQCGPEVIVMLARNTMLKTLGLTRVGIEPIGAAALARNTTLTTLSLNVVYLGDEAAAALAGSTTLTKVSVFFLVVTEDGETDLYLIRTRRESNRDRARALLDFCRAAPPPPLDAVTALLEDGVRPYGEFFQDILDNKDTLLHFAVRQRQPALVDLLLAHGAAADRNTKNEDGVTYRELAKELGVQLSSAYFGSMPPYY